MFPMHASGTHPQDLVVTLLPLLVTVVVVIIALRRQ